MSETIQPGQGSMKTVDGYEALDIGKSTQSNNQQIGTVETEKAAVTIERAMIDKADMKD